MKHRNAWKRAQRSVQALQPHRQQKFCPCPLALALCGALSLGVAHAQETFTYDGSNPGLRQTVLSTPNSLTQTKQANYRGNTITIDYTPNASNTILGYAIGGFSPLADTATRDNHIILKAGDVGAWGPFDLIGGVVGRSGSGDVENNTATMTGGSVGSRVIGGNNLIATFNANNNKAEVSGGSVGLEVIGGKSHSGNAIGNTASISGGIACSPTLMTTKFSPQTTTTSNANSPSLRVIPPLREV